MNCTQFIRLTLAVLAAFSVFGNLPAHALTEAQQDAAIASLQSTVAAQQTTINALMVKLQYVSVSGTDMTISGANLHVVSGSGKTNAAPNGLGNLIIGYNEARTGSGAVNTRTGSHNLILGAQNNYSSYGGIVAGNNNTVSGAYSSIMGGQVNTASGNYACVTGGRSNTASGVSSSISGGYSNAASGSYAAVGGGQANAASATYAFAPVDADVAGLKTQIASAVTTNISQQAQINSATAITNLFSLSNGVGSDTELTLTGVNLHIVNGLGATNGEPNSPYDTTNPVVNGLGNLIIGYNESRSRESDGNSLDVRTGSHNLIIGELNSYSSFGGLVAGDFNTISAPFASVTGGNNNTANGEGSSVSGGDYNTASGPSSSVNGGGANTASGEGSSVSGGGSSTASGEFSSISGGESNTASGGISSVSGGISNTASGEFSSVSGGDDNTASGNISSVGGGSGNTASGDYSSVSGGANLTANGSYTYDSGNGLYDIWDGVGPTWVATTFSGH